MGAQTSQIGHLKSMDHTNKIYINIFQNMNCS